ncbi:4-hydroxy-tetrahydrodipicolinate synthase [Burkholderia cenocepacia]|uniref:4-hydroxy-tetrahydrodipicolinate synthase n=1 Tax=Burkholderia cenocepacia TaxID=95486 RepID=UPI000F58D0BA|nr:4-hydroxy-tetrahydrodipicolinate synthase [Burkholderia cenocepacia]RQU32797.1 4-hydroxy-tetrahydrodipicolinate synthase [Burkholderia cenocepacia]RQU57010.1 4-hydroxy-tetrahydrodipicolinate synthase [Burkholderia cenocepacia]
MFEVSQLKGSITPVVTPFRNGAVDYDTYAHLVEWQIINGGHGVLVNGTTAEPSVLTVAERNRLVDVAVETAKGRVPVIAATGSQSHAETVELTTHADRAGVDGMLVVTPYYIRPPQYGLVEYYADIGTRTARPLMIYHIPGRAAVSMDLATVRTIRERVPNLVGMKHAVNDMAFVTQMLDAFGLDWRVFVGLEELSFPMLAVGACGLMNAVGNLAPGKVADLADAVERGDYNTARKLHFALFELNQSVFYDTNPIPIKYMMKRMGLIPSNEHRLPMIPATPELERRLDGVLDRAGLI